MNKQVIFFAAKLLPNLLGLATIAILTRILSPSDYGVYTFGLSLVFFMTIGTFEWIGLSVIRMAPTVIYLEPYYGTIMSCFCINFAMCIVAVAAALLTGVATDGIFLLVCLLACFGTAWTELHQRLQMAELRAHSFFALSLGRGLLTTVLVPAAAYVYKSPNIAMLAFAVANIVPSLLFRDRRLSFRRLRFHNETFIQLLRFGLPLSISIGLGVLLGSMDKWLLGVFCGTEAIGYFSAAVAVANVPVYAIASAIGPSAYVMAIQARSFGTAAKLDYQLQRNFLVLFCLILPATLGVIGLSTSLAHILVGPSFSDNVILLTPWLAASAFIGGMRSFYFDVVFQLEGNTKPLVGCTVLALATNAGLGVVLIPRLGLEGTAMGSLSAACVGCLASALLGRRRDIKLSIPVVEACKIVASALAMFLVTRLLPQTLNWFMLLLYISLAVAIFAAGLLLFNLIDLRDRLSRATHAGLAALAFRVKRRSTFFD